MPPNATADMREPPMPDPEICGVLGRLALGRPGISLADALEARPDLLRIAQECFLAPALAAPAPGDPADARREEAPFPPGMVVSAANEMNAERNAKILEGIEAIARLLNANGIHPVLIKGACHIATGLWRSPGARFVRDLDLLIPVDRIDEADRLLREAAGLAPLTERDLDYHRHAKHRPRIVAPLCPVPIELHHAVLPTQSRHLLEAGDVIASSRPCGIGAATIKLPSPAHQAMLAILHGPAGSGAWAAPEIHLRDLIDLALLLERHGEDIDWAAMERRFGDAGWSFLTVFANNALAEFTGTAGPFGQGTRAARLDWARWRWQLARPWAVRAGRLTNKAAFAVRSLVRGGEAGRQALGHLARGATYRRAYRRYVVGRTER